MDRSVNTPRILSLEPLNSFALYIHIPFCVTKCPYCDFNSYALEKKHQPETELETEKEYVDALCQEMSFYAKNEPWKDKRLSSIFFGGGTPSLLQAKSIDQILTAARESWEWIADLEITLESNPGTLREELGVQKLAGFKEAGINRLSFGAQSIREEKLKSLGRLHSVEDIHHSLAAAAENKFDRVSIDLIYGLPNESVDSWKQELEEVLSFAPSHLSAYTLTIEPGTEFASRQRKGIIQQATEDVLAQMYVNTQNTLKATGYTQYEVSNFAKPAQECQHNLSYWRWESFLGIGAGAHSFSRREPSTPTTQSKRWSNIPKPTHYIQRICDTQIASQCSEVLDRTQEELEVFYCFLRTSYGVPVAEYDRFFEKSLLNTTGETLERLLSEELISYNSDIIELTVKGFLFSDYVLAEFARAISDNT